MSNDVTRGVWVLDTAQAGVVVWPANLRAEAVTWANVGATGDVLVLQNKHGAEVFSFTAPAPGFYNFFKLMWGADGLIVAQLDSGKIYISIN